MHNMGNGGDRGAGYRLRAVRLDTGVARVGEGLSSETVKTVETRGLLEAWCGVAANTHVVLARKANPAHKGQRNGVGESRLA